MKQLNEFEQWADSILEFDSSNVKKSRERAPIGADRDIARQAQTKYAGYDKEQSLELFIADKLEDMEKRDFEQNKVINTQRRENDKLRKELTTLGQEVQDTVDTSQQDHQEIERLRTLAGQTKSDVETRQASRSEIEGLFKQVEELKHKPGISNAEYVEFKNKIEAKVKNGVDPEKLKQLEKQISDATKGRIDSEVINRLKDQVQQLETSNKNSASREDVQGLMSQLEQLKNKPGVSIEQYNELRQQIKSAEVRGVDPEKLKELEQQIENVSGQNKVGSEQLEKLNKMADELGAKQVEIATTERELAQKVADLERQHSDLINKEQELDSRDAERQGRFEEYKEKFKKFGDTVKNRLDQIEPDVKIAKGIAQDVGDELDILQLNVDQEQAKQNQYIEKHDAELNRLTIGDYSPNTKSKRKDYSPNVDDFDDMSHRQKFHKAPVDKDGNKNVDYYPNDIKIKLNQLYSPIGKDNNINIRLKNILATLKKNGNPKSKQERLDDIKRARDLVNNYKRMLDAKVSNQSATDTREKYNAAQKWYSVELAKLRALVNDVATTANISPDLIAIDAGFTGNYKRHLPETLTRDIDNLAENILGTQYSKYLKSPDVPKSSGFTTTTEKLSAVLSDIKNFSDSPLKKKILDVVEAEIAALQDELSIVRNKKIEVRPATNKEIDLFKKQRKK